MSINDLVGSLKSFQGHFKWGTKKNKSNAENMCQAFLEKYLSSKTMEGVSSYHKSSKSDSNIGLIYKRSVSIKIL